MNTRTPYLISWVIAVLTMLVYLSTSISPEWLWIMGFISWSIPFWIVLNCVILAYWIYFDLQKIWLPIVVILSGYSFIFATYTYSTENKAIAKKNFKVLSFNVRVFNVYEHLGGPTKHESSRKIINWLTKSDVDVICLQEFYNDNTSKDFSVVKKLKKAGYTHYYFYKALLDSKNHAFGLAIFSKHPITKKGYINQSKTLNQITYVDLELESGEELRIYNLHLQSMAISTDKLGDGSDDNSYKSTIKRMKSAFRIRSKQIDNLFEHISECEKKIIVCGDFNDLPYSYTYTKMRSKFKNAFESKGRGVGATYNGDIPYIRIDNQFYDKKIEINSFKVHRKMTSSDHFPIEANYYLD